MIQHIRPWQIFRMLPGDNPFNRLVTIPIPFRAGRETQTILSLETLMLITVIRALKAETVVEFGTSVGANALNLSMNTDATIHTVDIERVKKDYDDTPLSRAIVEHITSLEDFTPFPADVVFHDVNYTPETISTGTRKAFECNPKCVVWHDYRHPELPHVAEFLDELGKEKNLIHVEDSYMVFWFRDGI